jgi:MFS family permease
VILAGFVGWENRTRHPLLPLTLFRDRCFAVVQAATALMYLGMLGAVFLLAQFLQVAKGYSPLEAGVRTLPWTATMMLAAPVAGSLSDRVPRRTILTAGLTLQTAALAAIAALGRPATPYAVIAIAYAAAGLGMALYQAPSLRAILVTLPSEQHAKATGALTTIREASAVLGIAVLASLFARYGGYESAESFADGLRPALVAASIALAAAAVVVRFVPREAWAED